MNLEANEQQENEGTEQVQKQDSSVEQLAKDKAKEQTQKQIKKKLEKEGSKALTKIAAKSSLMAPLATILFWVVIVLVCLVIVVGISAFLVTMPGLVMQNLKSLAKGIGYSIASFFGADETKFVEDEDINNVLDYLNDMGYDLNGYGFLSGYENKDAEGYDNGVIRDGDTGKIKSAFSDIIRLYLISDNYVYTVSNFNLTSSTGFFFTDWIQALAQNFYTTLTSVSGASFIDTTNWGNGLINIKYEDGQSYTQKWFSWTKINLDVDKKQLAIRRGWGANYYTYNLDGWTGRYGMPIDFLLSLHLATLMPDLTYEMATNFDTSVNVVLHSVQGAEINSAYKVDKNESSQKYAGYVTYDELKKICSDPNSLTDEQAKQIFLLGIESSDNCEYSSISNVENNDSELSEETGAEENELPTNTYTNCCGAINEENFVCCENCKQHIREVMNTLADYSNSSLETYTPYISSVTNHWFRDVYFKTNSGINIIQNDDDYESLTNERWTMYETYPDSSDMAGEFILFELDDNGNYIVDTSNEYGYKIYNGTSEAAKREGVVVSKKAKTNILNSNTVDGSWSAYEERNISSESWIALYDDESATDIQKKCFYREYRPSDIYQIEEAVRGETNSKIKKIFLNNYYFKYDGTPLRAEQIYNAREQVKSKGYNGYGNLNDYLNETVNIDNKEYKIQDLSGKVSLNNDSLGAFSMLENTHTLDADCIYRDFKELIVELGYFTKEELTEGKAKMLEWIIPDIGSYGWPIRFLDKKESEYGTFIHSKVDYEAGEKQTLTAKLKAFNEAKDTVPDEESPDITITENIEETEEIALENFTNINMVNVGNIESSSNIKNPSEVSVQEFLQVTQEICEYMDEKKYDYCTYGNGEWHTQGRNHMLCTTFDETIGDFQKQNVCCATLVSWALQKVGLMELTRVEHGAAYLTAYVKEELGGSLVNNWEDLQPGDILCYGDNGQKHVEILGEKIDDSTYVKYNAGQAIDGDYDSYTTWGVGHGVSSIQKISKNDFTTKNIFGVHLNLTGTYSGSGKSFEGYEGNEAVVSPVTGILLDYNTYERKNVDTGKIDNVGYAKILVLDEENCDAIISCQKHNSSGVTSINTTPKTIDEFNNLSEIQKKLYGYRLFADDYKNANISGNIVFIEGFECELPNKDENNDISSDFKLSMDYFKTNAEDYSESKYTADKVYNLLDDNRENYLKSKVEAKKQASSLYYLAQTDTLFIKEGTVIGRTRTDDEVIENRKKIPENEEEKIIDETMADGILEDSNKGNDVDINENPIVDETDNIEEISNAEGVQKEESEEQSQIIGNYIRIIMRTTDDEIVEDVENYIKLDTKGNNSNINTDMSAQIQNIITDLNILPYEYIDISLENVNKYWDYIEKYSNKFGLDPYLVRALICAESGGNITYGGAATGIMQWEKTNGEPNFTVKDADGNEVNIKYTFSELESNIEIQIEVGCATMKQKLDMFSGNVAAMLTGYNFGTYGCYTVLNYHVNNHTGSLKNIASTLTEEAKAYVASCDTEWLKDADRQKYSIINNAGVPKYVEGVLKFYVKTK